MSDYYLCGWRVRSEAPLPELTPWAGGDAAVDIDIRLGEVPPLSPDATVVTPYLSVGRDGVARMAVDDAVHFTVKDGREIVLQPMTDLDDPAIRLFLLGTGLAVLCHQRGIFPLHGSCVLWGGEAVAFVGVSGAGKSTMAAVLRARGHSLLSDDVCAIDTRSGRAMVRPAFPRVKLWRDSMGLAGLPADATVARNSGEGKYHFRFTEGGAFQPREVPLGAIYLLSTAPPGGAAKVEPLRGAAAMTALHANVSRRRAARALGKEQALFGMAGVIAGSAQLFAFTRCAEPERLNESLAVLEASRAPA